MDFLRVNYDKYNKIWTGQKMSSLYNMEDNSLGRILFTQMKMHPSKVIQVSLWVYNLEVFTFNLE